MALNAPAGSCRANKKVSFELKGFKNGFHIIDESSSILNIARGWLQFGHVFLEESIEPNHC